MKLYFNGCSFTYGDELTAPEKHAWPVLVSRHLDATGTNDAVPGGTNERTLHLTLNQAEHHDFVIVAWTHYHRFTEYNPVDNFEINFTPQLNLDVRLHHSDDLQKQFFKYKKYGEMFYKYWFNELYEFKKWLQQIVLLQCFLRDRNKPYVMLNTVDNHLPNWLQPWANFNEACRELISFFNRMDDDQLYSQHQQIQHLASLIDKTCFVHWGTWCIKDLCSTHPCGPRGHILESGHRAVADRVLDHYNQRI